MSSITRFLALAAALLAMAFVGAGCGGGDSTTSGGGDAEAEITAVLEESVAFEDPAPICEENFTDKALEENYEGKDREAWIEDCSDDDPGGLTEIEISNVKVDGDEATAKVSALPEGEDEPAKFTVELINEDGWKIDGVE
ncbi:MAG: hypothetical protein M3335_02485 [Actinomycetota bacterium]|nr:hypothetical protein [Actinomycetota bacterium]